MATIKGIKVGTTTITASYTDNGVTKTATYADFEVIKATGFVTATTTNGTYTGSPQTIATIKTNSGAYYFGLGTSSTAAPTSWGSANTALQATNAGTYYVWAKCDESDNYNAVSATYIGTAVISARTVTIETAPTYVSTTLTYNGTTNANGTAQTLIASGSSEPACTPSTGGTFYYYVSTSSTAPTSFSASSGSGWSTTKPTGTNAGNYYVWYYCYVSDTANYTPGTNTNTIKAVDNSPKNIGRKKTATASANTGLVYNGTNNTNGTSQTGVTGSTVTWSGTTSAINADSYSATATPQSNFAWSDGTYAAKTVNWSIAKRGQGAPTLAGSTVTYPNTANVTVATAGQIANGTTTCPGTLTYKYDAAGGTSYTTSTTAPTRTVYGTTKVTAYYAEMSNFSASSDATVVDLKVNKRTVTITAPVFNGEDLTYDKTAKTLFTAGSCTAGGTMYYYKSTSSTAPAFSTSTWTTTAPTTETNAGTYYVWYYCYVSDTTNNTGTGINTVTALSGNSKTIEQRTVTLTFSPSPATWTYDGTQKTVTCAAGNVVSGDTCTVTLSNNTRTAQGSQTVTATGLSNNNYKLPATGTTTTLTINYATITVNTVGESSVINQTYVYNKTAQGVGLEATTAGNQTATIKYGTTSGTYNLNTAPQATNVSDSKTVYYQVTAANHTTVTGSYTLTITQKEVGLTWGTSSWVYDGTAKTLTCTATGVITGDTCTVTLSNNTRTAQGSQTASATGLSNNNYKLPSSGTTKSMSISKRPINITAASATKAYDGTALTNNSATAEETGTDRGLANSSHSMTSCTVTGSQTVVGSSANVPSGAVIKSGTTDVTSNYDITYVNGTLKVTAGTITVTTVGESSVINQSYTYNGSAQGVGLTGTASGGATVTIKYRTTSSGEYNLNTAPQATNVSDSKTVYYQATAANNTTVTGSYTLTITKRAITIDTAPAFVSGTLTYNKTAQTVATAGECSTGGTMYYYISTTNTTPTFSTSTWTTTAPTGVDAGTYYVWYYCQADAANNSGNINNVTKLDGSKAINQKTATLAWGTTSWEYDGLSHSTTCSVSNLITGDSCTVTLSGNTVGPNYGSATVTATALSNSNYKLPSTTTQTISITKKAATLPGTISGDRVDTDHTPARATVSKDYTGGTLQYSTDGGTTWNDVTWNGETTKTANPSTSTIGEVSVLFRVDPDGNHTGVVTPEAITLTVVKATDPSVTVTLAESPLTYLTTGDHKQTIATASNAHGISSYYIGYRKDAEATADNQITWNSASTTPLQATDAGEYNVYYKFTADSSHEGSKAFTYVGTVVINKADITAVTVNMTGYKYGGTKNNPSLSATPTSGGTVTYYYNTTNSNSGGTAWSTVTSSTSLNVGTYYMYAVVGSTSNYNGYTTATKSFTISKGDGVVTYSTSNPAAKYCITTANAADAAATDIEFTIATASASSSTNTGVTITYSISESGWSISSDGKKVTVPEDTPAGTYNITVTATAPATSNYNQAQATKSVKIILTAVVLTGVSLTIPVGQIAYNAETTATLVATYNNGETKDVSADSNTTYSSSPTGIVTITK